MIGLSGLITPSLEEMAHVAREMQRQGFDMPLLIGGATTSRVHTAVKIAPHYSRGPVVYVSDASRSVGVCQNLVSDDAAARFIAEVTAEYQRVREQHAAKKGPELVSLADARANATRIDWTGKDGQKYGPPKPKFIGRRLFRNYDLAMIAKYIDWGPFFQTWDLHGPFPGILTDEVVGEHARQVFAEGEKMLERAVRERWLTANGAVAFFPANAVGDDIELYTDDTRREVLFTWHGLRQQTQKPVIDGLPNPNQCLSDFIAPKESGIADYIGMFAVTTGVGVEERAARFVAQHDDYAAIMLKAIGDRLAEAFAELMHERVRKDLWGYAADEALTSEDLIKESYRGIRPAPGYPACPEHAVKRAHVRGAWRRRDRHDADRELRDVARPRASRASTSRTRRRSTSTSAASAATSSRTSRAASGSRSTNWNAGSLPTSGERPRGRRRLRACARVRRRVRPQRSRAGDPFDDRVDGGVGREARSGGVPRRGRRGFQPRVGRLRQAGREADAARRLSAEREDHRQRGGDRCARRGRPGPRKGARDRHGRRRAAARARADVGLRLGVAARGRAVEGLQRRVA